MLDFIDWHDVRVFLSGGVVSVVLFIVLFTIWPRECATCFGRKRVGSRDTVCPKCRGRGWR